MSDTIELGIPGLSLDVGDHVCAFFGGAAERDAILEAYLGAGLRSGDKCLCVLDNSQGGDGRALLSPHGRKPDPWRPESRSRRCPRPYGPAW